MVRHAMRGYLLFVVVLMMFVGSFETRAESLVIGSISQDAFSEMKTFLPLANYLKMTLKDQGITEVRVAVAREIPEMVQMMKDNEVDIYVDSLFPVMAVCRQANGRMVARRWKKGVKEFHSVIFAHKDAAIKTIDDLQGKIVAYDEPYSSSGYFLPKMYLTAAGLTLSEKASSASRIRKDEVGYVFSYDDENTVVWVLHGKVDAGAVSYRDLKRYARDDISQLNIIAETYSIPRHIVSIRGTLPDELADAIKRVLIEADQTPAGKSMLKSFQRTIKFDEIPDEITERMNEMMAFIDQEFNLRDDDQE